MTGGAIPAVGSTPRARGEDGEVPSPRVFAARDGMLARSKRLLRAGHSWRQSREGEKCFGWSLPGGIVLPTSNIEEESS